MKPLFAPDPVNASTPYICSVTPVTRALHGFIRIACVWVALWVTAFSGGVNVAQAALAVAPAVAPARLDLRSLDWRAIITGDAALKHPDVTAIGDAGESGPYVEAPGGAAGYALIDAIEFGDVSGDAQEEAVIQLFSGGTAGNTGVLVYTADANNKPVLAVALPGYKIYGRPDAGKLLVQQPIYAGWEPNCCASGLSTTTYQLRGRAPRFSLNRISSKNAGYPETRQLTVEQYYEYLAAKNYRAAYAFLSPRFQRTQPFNRWQAGFANTQSFTVEGAAGGANGAVALLLTSVDKVNGTDGTTRYGVSWQLVWSNAAKQWLLDRSTVTKLADDLGAIRGQLTYPSEDIPALNVYAKNTTTGNVISLTTGVSQGSYLIWALAGTYQVFAYLPDDSKTPSGAYTQFVVCGSSQNCTDHLLVPVTVVAGKVTDEINLTDWYAPAGTVPPKP